MSISEQIGSNMAKARNLNKRSLREVGERSGIHYANIGRIEKGIGNPSVNTLERIAEAIGCGVSDFFSGLELPHPKIMEGGLCKVLSETGGMVEAKILTELLPYDQYPEEFYVMVQSEGRVQKINALSLYEIELLK